MRLDPSKKQIPVLTVDLATQQTPRVTGNADTLGGKKAERSPPRHKEKNHRKNKRREASMSSSEELDNYFDQHEDQIDGIE